MLLTARILLLLLAIPPLAFTALVNSPFILHYNTTHAPILVLTTLAAGILAAGTFYLSQGLRNDVAAPERTGRKKGNAVALAGFGFLAFLWGAFSIDMIWPMASEIFGPDKNPALPRALQTPEGTLHAINVGAATLGTIVVGLLILHASWRPRKNSETNITDKGLALRYFLIFDLTFFFPLEALRLLIPEAPLNSDAWWLQLTLGDLSQIITNAILWSLLGLKCARHLHRGQAHTATPATSTPEAQATAPA